MKINKHISFNFEHFPILVSLYTALYLQEVHIALE